jgi:hypothetical protein
MVYPVTVTGLAAPIVAVAKEATAVPPKVTLATSPASTPTKAAVPVKVAAVVAL